MKIYEVMDVGPPKVSLDEIEQAADILSRLLIDFNETEKGTKFHKWVENLDSQIEPSAFNMSNIIESSSALYEQNQSNPESLGPDDNSYTV